MFEKVSYTLLYQRINANDVALKQAIPTEKVTQVDPFLLLHHSKLTTTADTPARHQDLDPHPHRGFTPVSFIIEG